MRFRRFAPAAAIAVALGATAATVAAAETCYAPTALCALFGAKEAEPTPPTPPTEAETPPKLQAAQRKPAAAAGTRTAKEGQARANRSTVKHHSKRRLAKVQPEPAVMRNLAPEAYALDTAALVRVVEPDEFNEIDRAAAPSDESRIAYAAEPKRESAQVDSVDQSNARLAVSLDMLARKLPVAYEFYSGESHGFRIKENLVRSLEEELYFYGEMMGFSPAGRLATPEIHNPPLGAP